MSPKHKVVVAREHLTKGRQETDGGDLRDAVQWAFASLEAAIDALAEPHGIAIDEKHWNAPPPPRSCTSAASCPRTSPSSTKS